MLVRFFGNKNLALGIAAVLLAIPVVFWGLGAVTPAVTDTAPGAAIAAAPAAATLPAGTRLHVRLQQTLSSNQSATGQAFTAVLDEPIVAGGQIIAPKGAAVHGRVAQARASGRLRTPAALYLRLTAIEVGGRRREVATNLVGHKNRSHKKRNLAWIGGGGATGTLIGALAGGGTGAAIGAAAGAGAGTAAAAFTGKKNIVYPVETRLSFRLTQPAAL